MKMDSNEIIERIRLSSFPLRKLNENNLPVGTACACLIKHHNRYILLTVQHATGDAGNWAVELAFDPGKGTQLYELGTMNFIAEGCLGKPGLRNIDFSYVEVPTTLRSFYQEIDPRTRQIRSQKQRLLSIPLFDRDPDPSLLYGFSGYVMPEMHPTAFVTEPRIYAGLLYQGAEGDYCVFRLPFNHPGHEHFEGCSGAPILDSKGSAVALVCRGDMDSNQIYGVSLRKYKLAIDLTYGS